MDGRTAIAACMLFPSDEDPKERCLALLHETEETAVAGDGGRDESRESAVALVEDGLGNPGGDFLARFRRRFIEASRSHSDLRDGVARRGRVGFLVTTRNDEPAVEIERNMTRGHVRDPLGR
jgi:hypothetical protein